MMDFTPNQWAILGLVLVLGWLLGLMSRSGAGKWRRAYEQEHAARRDLETQYEARVQASNQRIAELERYAPPITAATAATIGAAARGERDDLSLIRGVNNDLEQRLNDAGVHSFRDVSRLEPHDQAALEGRLGLEPGRIAMEQWPEQADMLAHGKAEEHRRAFA